ncbi:MAG TPA: sodium:calcium antiporter [Castellaniella sp.]|uniref:sodium:calcium antiporter n=1 Tax=Castellaniella sp. TaxID=1955812 RepID=UPI002EE9A99C
MLLAITLFLLSALAIYLASEYFVNGIEWLGRRLNLGATAVGSVLAAFGTALPESAVTFIAVVFGDTPAMKNVGVGAAMGGPLVLSTLAYSIVGLALMINHKHLKRPTYALQADCARLSRDQAAFLWIFVFKVALGLVVFAFKPWLGILFLLAYAVYVFSEIRDAHTALEEEILEPLKLRPHTAEPSLAWAALQSVGAMLVVAFASHIFVNQLQVIGHGLGWSAQLVALILSPIATELPEVMNALIWVRQGKERLALANISGSMMIQATIPSALGIFFTPWLFDPALILSGAVTLMAIIFMWFLFRRGAVKAQTLITASAFYAVFALGAFWLG